MLWLEIELSKEKNGRQELLQAFHRWWNSVNLQENFITKIIGSKNNCHLSDDTRNYYWECNPGTVTEAKIKQLQKRQALTESALDFSLQMIRNLKVLVVFMILQNSKRKL